MKIAIIGGGWVGSHLAFKLKNIYDVTIFEKNLDLFNLQFAAKLGSCYFVLKFLNYLLSSKYHPSPTSINFILNSFFYYLMIKQF